MSVLKGNKSFYDYEVSDALAYNLKAWLDYGLLEMGAYTNAEFDLPTSGLTNLKRVKDDRYSDGQVYEGMGPGWIWETDISPVVAMDPPFRASGVYVNNTFYPTSTTSGAYSHFIDFRDGRVVFSSGLPVTASVKCEYSFKHVATYLVDEPEWHTIVQQYTEKYDDLQTLSPSGMAQTLKEKRVWLPAVVIDVKDRENQPLQLGGGEINNFTVNYHIFSDKSFTNRRLADTLNNQYQNVIDLFDVNNLDFPYNPNGSLASGALTYPVIANRNGSYFWEYARIEATDGGPRDSDSDVRRAEITQTIAVDRHLITY